MSLLQDCPGAWWRNADDDIGDPISLVRAVNQLQQSGKHNAILAMKEFVKQRPDCKVVLMRVIPLLFERPDKMNTFAWFWDHHEIFIENSLTFHSHFYDPNGPPESFRPSLLEWVENFGQLRTSQLRPPDNPFPSVENALSRFKNNESDWMASDVQSNQYVTNYFYLQMVQATHHLSKTGKPLNRINSTGAANKWQRYKSELTAAGIYWDESKMQYSIRNRR